MGSGEIIFLGGVTCSGKSTFGAEVYKKMPERYVHLDMDATFKGIVRDGTQFFKYFKMWNRMDHDKVKTGMAANGIFDSNDQLKALMMAMRLSDPKGFLKLTQGVAYMALAYQMVQTKEQTPLLEMNFTTVDMRRSHYNDLKLFLEQAEKNENVPKEEQMDLDGMKKKLFYFDVGEDSAIAHLRMRALPNERHRPEIAIMIMNGYESQEVPTDGELPNLSVQILRTDIEVRECLEDLVAKAIESSQPLHQNL